MEYHDHAAPFREAAPQAEGTRCPTCHSTSQNIINRVAYNVNRPYHGEWCKDSWHMGAAPAETEGEMTARDFRKLIPLEHWTDEQVEAFAKQRVEQAERRNAEIIEDRRLTLHKVADLERERDEARDEAVHQNDLLKTAESELREMREALAELRAEIEDNGVLMGEANKRELRYKSELRELKEELEAFVKSNFNQLSPTLVGCGKCRQTGRTRLLILHKDTCAIGTFERLLARKAGS